MIVPIGRIIHYIACGLPLIRGQLTDSSLADSGVLKPEINLFWSTVKVAFALGLTLVLLVVVVWLLKKLMDVRRIPGVRTGAIDVLEVRYLAPKSSIALVRIAGSVLIVGITEQGMSRLGKLSAEEVAGISTVEDSGGGFRSVLDGFRKKI